MTVNTAQINAFNRLSEFMNFAADKTENTIIHFGPGNQRFSVAEGDRIRSIFHWTAPGRDVDANNNTRDAFKTALLDLFKAENVDQLPKPVKDVLKAGDFNGSGKPLSARRIRQVMDAVTNTNEYDLARDTKIVDDFVVNTFHINRLADNRDSATEIRHNLYKLAESLCSPSKNGGGGFGMMLKSMIRPHDGDETALIKGMIMCMTGIQTAMYNGGTFYRLYDNKTVGTYDKNSAQDSNFGRALEHHVKECKKFMADEFRKTNAGKNLDIDSILDRVFEKLDYITNTMVMRFAALDNLDKLPGDITADKIWMFEMHVDTMKSPEASISDTIDDYLKNRLNAE